MFFLLQLLGYHSWSHSHNMLLQYQWEQMTMTSVQVTSEDKCLGFSPSSRSWNLLHRCVISIATYKRTRFQSQIVHQVMASPCHLQLCETQYELSAAHYWQLLLLHTTHSLDVKAAEAHIFLMHVAHTSGHLQAIGSHRETGKLFLAKQLSSKDFASTSQLRKP